MASRTIAFVVILAINQNSSICWLSLMASGINNQDPVSEARRFIFCGSCVVMQKIQKLFCWECGLSYHRTCSNLGHKSEHSSICWLCLMASDINNQDPVSEARRFIYCGSCLVMQKIQKLFCRECGLSYHRICSNLGHK